jgi:hypothetical protein
MSASRRGFGTLEMLVGICLGVIVLTMGYLLLRFSRVSTEASLGPNMGLQTASRKAMVELIRELQESIEVVRPVQGSSLTYVLARDKLNRILTVYLVRNEELTTRAGRPLYDLYLHRNDHGASAPGVNQRYLIGSIERAAFTSLSSGLLQIHLDFHEQGRTYPFLTAVRSRNIQTEAQL